HQRRRNQRQEDVLQHVRAEQILVREQRERRNQGNNQRQNSRRPKEQLSGRDGLTVRKFRAQRTDSEQVCAVQDDNAKPDSRVKGPCGPPKISGRNINVHLKKLRVEQSVHSTRKSAIWVDE